MWNLPKHQFQSSLVEWVAAYVCDVLGSLHGADSYRNKSRSNTHYILCGHGYRVHGAESPINLFRCRRWFYRSWLDIKLNMLLLDIPQFPFGIIHQIFPLTYGSEYVTSGHTTVSIWYKKTIHQIFPLMSICLETCKFMPLSVFYSICTYPKRGYFAPFFYVFLHYLLSVKIVIIVT